jgi:hypothetical protein
MGVQIDRDSNLLKADTVKSAGWRQGILLPKATILAHKLSLKGRRFRNRKALPLSTAL